MQREHSAAEYLVQVDRGHRCRGHLVKDSQFRRSLPSLFVEPGIFDGHGHLVGEGSDQSDMPFIEMIQLDAVYSQYPDHPVLDD